MKSRLGDRCGSESARAVGQFLREADSWVAPLGLADWFCDLTLVGDGVMRDLNGRYRGRDAVTDVLSFSALEETGSLPPDLPGGQAGAHADLWLDSLQAGEPGGVGEIILAPDFIARRCAENGWPLAGRFPCWWSTAACICWAGTTRMKSRAGPCACWKPKSWPPVD